MVDKEYIIDIGLWTDTYPGLTWNRVQAAAKALDESQPHWRNAPNHIKIMIRKVAEQNPKLIEKWAKKGVAIL